MEYSPEQRTPYEINLHCKQGHPDAEGLQVPASSEGS